MRFASLGGSNAGKYAAAGKSVADSAAKMHAVQRKTGPDYVGLSKVAMKTASNEKIAGMEAEAKLTNVAQKVYANQKQVGYDIEVFNKKSDIKASQRKAGGLAAIGKIAGAGFLAATDNTKGRERPKADYQGLFDKSKAERAAIKERQNTESDSLGTFTAEPYKPSTGDSPGKVTSGSASPANGKSSNLGGQPFDLSKLTDNDYKELGYVISSEAALNTNDEFGVAANVLTRLQSGKYGNNIGEIIRAKGQYEGVYTGNSRYSPEIVARLKSPEGQKKIQDYFQQLNGRTEFKGQSMLGNRVASEDPMFDPKGNFYHYSGQ